MVLDVNTQACAVAIVRFDRTPIMQETPKSEKQLTRLHHAFWGFLIIQAKTFDNKLS